MRLRLVHINLFKFNICVAELVVQQYRTRALPHRADVDHDASEDVTLNVDRSVDEDYSRESSELAQ